MRLFIALTFFSEDLQRIIKVRDGLRQIFPPYGLRWVQSSNIHLTMKFLGNVEPSRLPEIKRSLFSAVKDIPLCSAELGGLGAYPSLTRPQNIWIGLKPDTNLELLSVQLEKSLSGIGFPIERRGFSPHVTLARISDHIAEKERTMLSNVLKSSDISVISSPVFDTLYLIKSDLDRSGPTYTRLIAAPFLGH